MTLPFEKDTAQKFQCFVCGVIFPNFQEYNDHILENHDEGREYVKCPLQRCGACVRCIKKHFAAKHPTEKLPKTGAMRAMIWKDFGPKGKLKTRKPNFRDGYMISLKNHGKELHYRSGLECEFYECLELISEVLAYDVEPFKSGIPYLFNGEQHHYHPDLSLQFSDGHIEIWEIKPSTQQDLPVNKAKWEAATHYCEARGWSFVVMTEVGLHQLKQKILLEQAQNTSSL